MTSRTNVLLYITADIALNPTVFTKKMPITSSRIRALISLKLKSNMN